MKKKTLIIFYTVLMPLSLLFGSVCGAVKDKAQEPAPKIMFAHVDVTERVITVRDKVFAIPEKNANPTWSCLSLSKAMCPNDG